jgi:hypothetical protein
MSDNKVIPYTISDGVLTATINRKSYSLDSTHKYYKEVVKALKAGDKDKALHLLDLREGVQFFGQGHLGLAPGDGTLLWDDEELHDTLAARIVDMHVSGMNVEPFVRFMENLRLNPAKYAITETYDFLRKSNLPLTDRGTFIAYKRVNFQRDFEGNKNSDMLVDCHSASLSNNPGDVQWMDRARCDANRHNVCSSGLHFCSLNYLSSFSGDVLVIVEINPGDITSIPVDYDYTKGRTCRYQVVGVWGGREVPTSNLWSEPVIEMKELYSLLNLSSEVIKKLEAFPLRVPMSTKPQKVVVNGQEKEVVTLQDGDTKMKNGKLWVFSGETRRWKLAPVDTTPHDQEVFLVFNQGGIATLTGEPLAHESLPKILSLTCDEVAKRRLPCQVRQHEDHLTHGDLKVTLDGRNWQFQGANSRWCLLLFDDSSQQEMFEQKPVPDPELNEVEEPAPEKKGPQDGDTKILKGLPWIFDGESHRWKRQRS